MKKADIVSKEKIYAYIWPGETEAVGIAMYIDIGYEGFEGICFLSPPDRGHMLRGKLGKKTKDGFTFYQDGQREPWRFVELTYENFRDKYHTAVVRPQTVLEAVSNTQELEDFYHKNFPL